MATIKRNRTLSLLFLFFCNTIAIAQTQPDTNKSTKFSYATPFQLLEPKYITTGILHNRVIDYSKIQKFQGLTTDSITDYNNWYQSFLLICFKVQATGRSRFPREKFPS